jgi:uncharacterized membrane protein
MWKVLLAVFLILVLWLLYSNDMNAQKSVDDLKARASSLSGGAIAPPAAPSALPAAPTALPAAPTAPTALPAPVSDEPKKEGFCPKLMQKYGFCDAGESMNNPSRGSVWDNRLNKGASAIGSIMGGRERLAGGDVAKNTVWTGYMRSAVLPY